MSVTDRGINQKTGKLWDKRWMAGWRDPWGTWRTKCLHLKADAQRHERDMMAQVRNGTYGKQDTGPVPFSPFMTQLLAELEAEGELESSTISTKRSHQVCYLDPLFGQVLMQQHNAGHSRALLSTMRKDGCAPGYVKAVVGTYRWAMQKAVDKQVIAASPVPRNSVLKLEVPSRRVEIVLEDDEVEALIAQLPERHRALFMVYAFCGPRQGEGLGITWDRVDFDQLLITIDQQLNTNRKEGTLKKLKTPASYRTIPMTRRVATAIKAHKLAYGLSPEGLVFTNMYGASLSHYRAHQIVKAAAKRAGLNPKVSTHDLRHYWISCLRRDGSMTDEQIAVVAGHSNTNELRVTYSHPFAGASDRAREAMERVQARASA